MRPLVYEITTGKTPECLVAGLLNPTEGLKTARGVILLDSAGSGLYDRYSFVTANPFLTFRSFGSRCEISSAGATRLQFGNPWHLLDALMARCELLEEMDLPFPLGGCFGYWGYELKNFVEPKLPRTAINDLEMPDAHVGFYDSLVVFDHHLAKTWIVSTGLNADGSRSEARAKDAVDFWERQLSASEPVHPGEARQHRREICVPNEWTANGPSFAAAANPGTVPDYSTLPVPSRALRTRDRSRSGRINASAITSTLSRDDFITRVQQAQRYIRSGDIYQVNLSHRLASTFAGSGWQLFQRLKEVSPAPFSAFLDCQDFQLASSSPELFLRLSSSHILTRPIKGTRPRSADITRDAQLTYELQTSAKEMAELVMITDLLRNDLGKVCEFGSVQVPELVRLERYPQVQHLVSTVEGRLRSDVTHFSAFSSCFPGGSITGAPKFRAMEIIDELEPVSRGFYTGALGYLGFNRESQLSISIRTAMFRQGNVWFHAGAGIVADSVPEAEYDETIAKAQGFLETLRIDNSEGSAISEPTEKRSSAGGW
jgi:para-aminobenzoate synthetase component I